jgi:hypothetical protein
VVVDHGRRLGQQPGLGPSVDETIAVGRRLRPDVRVGHADRPGEGDALPCRFATRQGDLIVMLDAGSTNAGEMTRFVDAHCDGAHFVNGSRFLPDGSDDLILTRRLGKGLLSGLVNRLFGTSYTDLCYG